MSIQEVLAVSITIGIWLFILTSLHISIQSFTGKFISRIIKSYFFDNISSTAFSQEFREYTSNQEFSKYNFKDKHIHKSSSIIKIFSIFIYKLFLLFNKHINFYYFFKFS